MDKLDGPDVMYLDGISGGIVIALFFIFTTLCFKKLAKSAIKCAEKKILEKIYQTRDYHCSKSRNLRLIDQNMTFSILVTLSTQKFLNLDFFIQGLMNLRIYTICVISAIVWVQVRNHLIFQMRLKLFLTFEF